MQYIRNIHQLVREAKRFLRNMKTLSLTIRASDKAGNDHSASLYAKEKYVIVIPHGKKKNALLYGNWDEALQASKKLLIDTINLKKTPKITLNRFTNTS